VDRRADSIDVFFKREVIMERPLNRKLIGLLGLVGFFFGIPLAKVLHSISGLPEGLFTTLLWSLAAGVLGFGFDGFPFARLMFVMTIIGGSILHVVEPLGVGMQSICFVAGVSVTYSIFAYFEVAGT
jgi:hypothetical protein